MTIPTAPSGCHARHGRRHPEAALDHPGNRTDEFVEVEGGEEVAAHRGGAGTDFGGLQPFFDHPAHAR
jgi:hypothetical protein